MKKLQIFCLALFLGLGACSRTQSNLDIEQDDSLSSDTAVRTTLIGAGDVSKLASEVNIEPAIDAMVALSSSAAVVSWQENLGSTLFLSNVFFGDGGPLDQFSKSEDRSPMRMLRLRQAIPFTQALPFVEVLRGVNSQYTLEALRNDTRNFAHDVENVGDEFYALAEVMTDSAFGVVPNRYMRNDTEGDLRLGRADMYVIAAHFYLASAMMRQSAFYSFGQGTLRSLIDETDPIDLANRLNAFAGQLGADVSYRREAGQLFQKGLLVYMTGLDLLNSLSLMNASDPRALEAVAASRDLAQTLLLSYQNQGFVRVPHAQGTLVDINAFNLFEGDTPDAGSIPSFPFTVEFGSIVAVESFWEQFYAPVIRRVDGLPGLIEGFDFTDDLFEWTVVEGLASRLGLLRIANEPIYQSKPYDGGGTGKPSVRDIDIHME